MERPRSPINFRFFALVRKDVIFVAVCFEFLSESNFI